MKSQAPIRDILLASTAMMLAALAIAHSWAGPPGSALWFWVATCFAGEILWVRLPFGGATLSMASACNFAAMLLLPPGDAMVAAAVGGLVAETLVMRKPPIRVLFNAAQTVLAVAGGGLAYHILAGGAVSPVQFLSLAGLPPLVAAAAAYTLINTGSVSLAVGLAERVSPWKAWRANFGSRYEMLSNWALFSLGVLLAVLYSLAGPLGLLFVSLPLVLARESYRRHLNRSEETPERSMPVRAA